MKANCISAPLTRQFLELVRATMWQTPVDCRLFRDYTVDWEAIGKLSLQQTVGNLVIEGAMSLPPELMPPKEWLRYGYSFIERNRRTHLILDSCVAEAVRLLQETGIKAILLKGQAYARCYPQSDLRQCGDIDLYVGESNYLPAYKAACKLGWESSEKFIPDSKHYGCTLRGIRIELHRLAGRFPSHSVNRRFQEWSRRQLSAGERSVIIGGEEIPLPTPIFDVIFVFMHLYLHFINGGIGLRHICDWVLLLHTHSDNINRQELRKCLKDFRLLKAWCLFTPIAVEQLGVPQSECPFYSAEYRKKSNKIFSFILRGGNFGRYGSEGSGRPEGYLKGKLYSLRRHSKKMLSYLSIDPNTVIRHYSNFLFKGTKIVLTDILKKN
ncbi:MAG: nucleotidyltransferase family protein [Muribaculaceae bacterium]|nr:nucleotidyltransferase family protein [Muribaculaceae bacterium]